MHLAPTRILHVFEAGNRRAEVQYVEGERFSKYRVIHQIKLGNEWLMQGPPEYMEDETNAKSRARIWAYR